MGALRVGCRSLSVVVVALLGTVASFSTHKPNFAKRNTRLYDQTSNNDASSRGRPTSSTFETALGIVPPDDVWDTIQRARYIAQDKSYTVWPPCLRIFHPFGRKVDELAMKIGACIDELEIESFEVCLSEWSIIPHAEAMELNWWRSAEEGASQSDSVDASAAVARESDSEEQTRYNSLVQREQELGWERLQQRRVKEGLEPLPTPPWLSDMDEQARSTTNYQEFDGPCVLCLEPDLESREDLMTLRSVLQQEGGMARFSPFCPTATVDPSIPNVARFADFRPIIPIASFLSVTEAIPVAQKLRKLWEPLTWEVTDLQVLTSNTRSENEEMFSTAGNRSINPSSYAAQPFSPEKPKSMECSAMIMLSGEEMEMDDALNSKIVNMVAQTGQDGGFVQLQQQQAQDLGNPYPPPAPMSPPASGETNQSWSANVDNLNLTKNGRIDDIEAYLAEENEDDEGTVVVIGRVHFFDGNARQYQGMPADTSSL
jgi:hypothetical protein